MSTLRCICVEHLDVISMQNSLLNLPFQSL